MFNWQKSLTLALVLTTIAGLAMLAGDSTPSPSGFTWGSPVGMNSPRSNACPAALPDGRILISGGAGTNGPLASAEIYGFDGRFEIAASMTEARSGHGCAVLPDGKILVAGGWVSGGGVTNGVEIYDPEANAWTAGPPLLTARAGATVSVLPDGRLLIAGGESAAGPTDGLEIFDPRLGKFQAVAGRLTSPRTAHAAAVLADGRVVIAGGTDGVKPLDAIDLFEPATGRVAAAGRLSVPRFGLTATTLLHGEVLLLGGSDGNKELGLADLFNPSTGKTRVESAALQTPRQGHLAVRVPNNNGVLIVGGLSQGQMPKTAELYIPWMHAFQQAGEISAGRVGAVASALSSRGKTLIAGGRTAAASLLNSAETLQLPTIGTDKADYAPGEPVTFNGANWAPNGVVTVTLTERYDGVLTGDVINPITLATDSNGNIVDNNSPHFAPDANDLGVTFYVTATQQVKASDGSVIAIYTAQSSFTDGPGGTFTATIAPTTASAGTPTTYTLTLTNTTTNGGGKLGSATVTLPPNYQPIAATDVHIVNANWTVTSVIGNVITLDSSPKGVVNGGESLVLTVTATANAAGEAPWTVVVNANPGVGGTVLAYQGSTFPTVFIYGPTSLAVSGSATYGGTATLTATLTSAGLPVAGQPVQFMLDGASAGQATTDALGVATITGVSNTRGAGTYNIVSASFIGTTVYGASAATGTLTVAARPITVTADAKTKVYGESDPALTYQITAGSLLGSDSLSGALTRAPGENVNTYGILQGSLTAGPNYTLTFAGANFTISAAALTVAADAKTKVYGESDPELTYRVTTGALKAGDSFSGALTREAGEDVGTYLIQQGTLSAGSNYTISYTGANFSITARALTVTADAKTKVYGDADPALTYQITTGSLKDGDSFTGALSRVAGEDVGTYAIQQGTLSAGTNYNLTFAGADLTITARAITVTADPTTKVYGDADPALTYQITSGSLAGTDALSGSLTRASGENVGNYAIQQGTLAAGSNYNLTFIGANLAITARALTVTADAKTKTYGEADPALTYQITGGSLAGSDALNGSLSRVAGEDVGNYAIQQGSLTAGGNYNLAFIGANLAIAAKALTVTADAKTKTYGEADPALTYQLTVGELKAGDSFTGSLTRAAGEDAGKYAIEQGTLTAGTNYAITYVGANLTITAKAITVTADAKTKTYGDADPALTYQITTGALKEGDTLSGALTRAAGENVGPYAIQQGTLAAGGNYTITFVSADLTITARAVTITADAKSKVYGDTDPALTYQITAGALKEGDLLSGSLSRAAGENVGAYAIQQGSLAAGSNYALTFVPANLTITTRALTVTADPKTKIYTESDPALTYRITTGSLAGDDALTGALTRVAGESVGAYAIQQGTLTASANYALTFIGAELTITNKAITITADPASKVYGDGDPALTYRITAGSLAPGDSLTGSLSRAVGTAVGAYAIQQGTLRASGDYAVTFIGADLTITARPLTVTAAPKTKVYGEADPALTYQITSGSLAYEDSLTGSIARAAGENAGPHAIQQGSLTAGGNYALTFVGANLTITPRPIAVAADAKSKLAESADPELTYRIVSGALVAGDSFAGSLTRAPGEEVGTYPILVGTLTAGDNYALSYTGASLTVRQRIVTITVQADPKTKVYGDDDPAFTYHVTSGVLERGDVFSGSLSREPGKDVGTYQITQGTLSLGSNYKIVFVGSTLTITKRKAMVIPNDPGKPYGTPDPALTGVLIGFVPSDNIVATYTRVPGEALGKYKITATLSPESALANYDITYYTAEFTIGRADTRITLVGTPAVLYYGQAINLVATLAGSAPSGTIPPGGYVEFWDGVRLLGRSQVTAGVASLAVPDLGPGTHKLEATYTGFEDFGLGGKSYNAVFQAVVKMPSAVKADALPDVSGVTPQLTLTATVGSGAPGVGSPTGEVQFFDMSTNELLGTARVNEGKAILSLTPQTIGARKVKAIYGGDTNFGGGESMPAPQLKIVNAADYLTMRAAPDSIMTLFGSSMAQAPEEADLPLPTELAGAKVRVTDSKGVTREAPLFYASDNQINLAIPAETAPGRTTVTVVSPNGESYSIVTATGDVAPGLFAANANGRGLAAAQVTRVSADGKASVEPVAGFNASNTSIVPIPIEFRNDTLYLVLYGTGLRNAQNAGLVQASIGGLNVPIMYIGPQPVFPGLDQVNLGPLPKELAGRGEVDIQLAIDGKPVNTVTVTFQ